MKRLFVLCLVFSIAALAWGLAFGQTGVKKKRPLPVDYGKAVLNNSSEKSGMAPVVFDHWVHRAKFTCRLCHVDIGFAMKTGGTGIRAADNMAGYYCGACHNGKAVAGGGKPVFASCAKTYGAEESKRCERCHYTGKPREYDFGSFSEKLPKERFGNGIDWEKAEADGQIRLTDYLEGVSIPRKPLKIQEDFSLEARVRGMPEIIFSHKKHTTWNGCEVCHPEIFVGVKKGTTKYSMVDIFDGRYCGACHGKVAFPLIDCQRCHTKPV